MTPVAAAGGFPCEPPGLEAFAVIGSSFLENAFCCRQATASQETAPARGAAEAVLGGLCRGATRHGSDCEPCKPLGATGIPL
jgi:hypothetical protein